MHDSDDMNRSESDREFISRSYDPPVTYGLDEDIRRLKEWMFGSNKGKLDFVGIVGMGGLGKTTIAKKVFIDEEVMSYFNKMIWVSVTQNVSVQRIVNCMLKKINLKKINLQAPAVSESDKMFNMLQQGLDDQAYLIVMDDVWDKPNLFNFWNDLRNKLPTNVGKSSCIIITSSTYDVARRMVDPDSLIIKPPTLNENHSWSLFSSFAFRSTEGKCPDERFEKEGKVIMKRCLLEVVDWRGYDGRIHKFRIHNMVRELITKIAEKEKFCNFGKDGMQIKIEDSRWLCLAEDMAAEVKNPWNKRNTKLRALLLISSPTLIDFSRNFVLLERLACLNLTGVQKLLEVTSEIEKLLNLQVLVLNGCKNLGKMHAKISSLKRLVVLDIGTCPLLQHPPRELGSLSYLQELSGFRVISRAKTRGCTLLELGKLEQLRVLRITICDVAEISEKKKKSLSSLQNLKVLAIDADTCKEGNLEMIDELELPPKIEELYLRNYLSPKMPNWFSPSRLPKLHYLSIEDCDVGSLQENSCSWKIEGLYLNLLHMLKVDWNDLKRVVPALHYMEISNCSNLKNFPIDVVKPGVWRK